MLVRALAVDKIAEALDQNAAREQVRKGRNVLAVAVRLVKRLREAVRDEKGKVRVFAPERGVRVRVAVHGIDALDIFRDDVAVRVHAERAHLIAILLGAVDELRLIDDVCDVLKDRRRKLDAHAHVDLIVQ